MNFTNLNTRPEAPVISGSWTRILIALDSWFLTKPRRDTSNEHQISENFIFKTGYAWVAMYVTQKTTNLEETGSEQPDNHACTTTFKFKVAGFDDIRREFITKYGKEPMVVLIQKCGETYPKVLGDSCSVVNMSWKYAEGGSAGDEAAVEMSFVREGAYPAAIYKGSVTNTNIFANNDATPSLAGGTFFMTATGNSGALEITALDDAVVGGTYTIIGSGGTNGTEIQHGTNFNLVGEVTWEDDAGAFLTLYCHAAGKFVELSRG